MFIIIIYLVDNKSIKIYLSPILAIHPVAGGAKCLNLVQKKGKIYF